MTEKILKKPSDMNALALAYIGDAVYEIYIRKHVLFKGNYKPNILHQRAIAYVSAKSQAKIIQELQPELLETEKEVVKRGRNMKSYTSPKNTEIIDYRYSTGFEALIGFLYLQGEEVRLEQIINKAILLVERNTKNE